MFLCIIITMCSTRSLLADWHEMSVTTAGRGGPYTCTGPAPGKTGHVTWAVTGSGDRVSIPRALTDRFYIFQDHLGNASKLENKCLFCIPTSVIVHLEKCGIVRILSPWFLAARANVKSRISITFIFDRQDFCNIKLYVSSPTCVSVSYPTKNFTVPI